MPSGRWRGQCVKAPAPQNLLPCAAGNSTLRVLDLGQAAISDYGAQAIAEGLKLNTTLVRLDLSGNAIDEKGTGASLILLLGSRC